MQASSVLVIQYFNGEKQNLIPLFQRPYSWKKDNWQTLWDDVLVHYDMEEKTTHFMGAIVSVPAKSVPVGVNKYLIIDGQQRLTTVSILLCALRDSLDPTESSRIQEVYLINKFRPPEDTLKFVPTHADRSDLTNLVVHKIGDDLEVTIGEAYRFFKRLIQSGYDLDSTKIDAKRLLTTIEHSLEVVMINLEDADDPYLIFESLNFKGEPLTQADLVRNYVLMQFKHSVSSGGDQERIHQSHWKPMEDALGDRLTDFLRYYLMRHGDVIYLGGIYASIKAHLKGLSSPEAVENEVQKHQKFSRYYQQLLNSDLIKAVNIRRRIKNIRDLAVATSYPFLLRLFEAEESGSLDQAAVESCLGLIESFIVRRSVCGVPTNNLNKLFLQWSKSFPLEDHATWLRKSMSTGSGGRRYPTDIEFGEAFKNQPQYGRGATRFILLRLEESFEHKEPISFDGVTIEHVMPRTMSTDWENELGPNAAEIHAKFIDTIGNLTLTGYNSELGNLSFEQKREKLARTHIELSRWIAEQSEWTEVEISKRAESLLEKSRQIWTGPA